MKIRYYNKAAALVVFGVAVALTIVLWPGLGRSAEPQELQNAQQPQDSQEPLDIQPLQGPPEPQGAQPPQGTQEPQEIQQPPDVLPSEGTQELQDMRPPQSTPEPQDAQAQDPWTKYQIILERNIFSRQRGPIRRAEDMPERREVVIPNPESYFVLKGIVQEDGKFLAFIEDTRSSSVLRLGQGDAVAGGTIAGLTLDEIEFQMNDRTIAVGLGRNLEGGLGSGAVTVDQLMQWSDTASSTPESTTAAPEPSATGAEADILKQLMERRKQQLGQ